MGDGAETPRIAPFGRAYALCGVIVGVALTLGLLNRDPPLWYLILIVALLAAGVVGGVCARTVHARGTG